MQIVSGTTINAPSVQISAVPESGTRFFLGIGLIGIRFLRRSRSNLAVGSRRRKR